MKLRSIKAEMPQETEQQALTNIMALKESLPFLISLPKKERVRLVKLSRKRQDFIDRALMQAEQYPGLVPPHCELEEFKKVLETIKSLQRIQTAQALINSQIKDTIMYARAQAYEYSRAFYNSVKVSANHNVPGTEEVLKDLSYHFKNGSPVVQETIEVEETAHPEEQAA